MGLMAPGKLCVILNFGRDHFRSTAFPLKPGSGGRLVQDETENAVPGLSKEVQAVLIEAARPPSREGSFPIH